MPVASDESRQVIDDIDLFRMQLSHDDGDQPQQVPTLSTNSKDPVCFRSRDEVAHAILKLRGKEKQAENIDVQGAHFQYNTRSVVKISEEAKEQTVIADEPAYNITGANETEGLLESLFRRAFCAIETQPNFSAEDEDYAVEGIANLVQELKIETSSKFLSPPPPASAYIHDAPCDVVHYSESIGGCSTMTHSVAGKIAVRDKAKDVCDNTATTKSSTLSDCASSLMTDRDSYASYDRDVQMVSKVPSTHTSDTEYQSRGSGSKEKFAQYDSASKSFLSMKSFLSFIDNVGKGSLLGLSSSASELGTQSSLQSFSMSLREQDGDTFSSASGGSSEEDSDYTSVSCSIDESSTLSSYASTVHEPCTMKLYFS